MRQLIIQVPRGKGKAVIDIAKSHNGANLEKLLSILPNLITAQIWLDLKEMQKKQLMW